MDNKDNIYCNCSQVDNKAMDNIIHTRNLVGNMDLDLGNRNI